MQKLPLKMLLAWLVVMGGISARAQDVTVSEPQWFESTLPPEKPLTLSSTLRVTYPDQFSDAVSGYAFVRFSVDAKGHRTATIAQGTHPEFTSSVAESIGVIGLTFNPAEMQGSTAASQVWYSVIFNAADTSPKLPDAKPRLLAVAPAFVSGKGRQLRSPIWAEVSLDAQGVPQKFVLEKVEFEDLRPDLERSLKLWKFAPARKRGLSVASKIRVAFFSGPHWVEPRAENLLGASNAAGTTLPKPIRRVQPVYPPAMRASGMIGEVLVGFEVDPNGNPTKVSVIRSDHPGFDAAAVEAVQQWEFEPARRDGIRVAFETQAPIVFVLSDEAASRGRRPAPADQSVPRATGNEPTQTRSVEVPARATVLGVPVYPYAQLRDGVKGKATIVALVNGQGTVTKTLVVEATEPAFGYALAAAYDGVEISSSRRGTTSNSMMLRKEFSFDPEAKNSTITDTDRRLLEREKNEPETILTAGRLDNPLKPTVRRAPVFPDLMYGKSAAGEATIEFLVDEQGHVCLPRVVAASGGRLWFCGGASDRDLAVRAAGRGRKAGGGACPSAV